MKKIRERKLEEEFKYRNFIVKVKKYSSNNINYCNECCFQKQNKRGNRCYRYTYNGDMKYSKCCQKHRCHSSMRSDKQNVYFVRVKLINK